MTKAAFAKGDRVRGTEEYGPYEGTIEAITDGWCHVRRDDGVKGCGFGGTWYVHPNTLARLAPASFRAGEFVRVVRVSGPEKDSHPIGVVRQIRNTQCNGALLGVEGGSAFCVRPENVEPWRPRPGERVEYRGPGATPWTGVAREPHIIGNFVGILRDDGVSSRRDGLWHGSREYVAPVLDERGFPVTEASEKAEPTPNEPEREKSPPPVRRPVACGCGAPLVESFVTRRCERGCEGASTYVRPGLEPERVEERWETRRHGRTVTLGRVGVDPMPAGAERHWTALGRAPGGDLCASDHPTRDGAIAAWRALVSEAGRG